MGHLGSSSIQTKHNIICQTVPCESKKLQVQLVYICLPRMNLFGIFLEANSLQLVIERHFLQKPNWRGPQSKIQIHHQVDLCPIQESKTAKIFKDYQNCSTIR